MRKLSLILIEVLSNGEARYSISEHPVSGLDAMLIGAVAGQLCNRSVSCCSLQQEGTCIQLKFMSTIASSPQQRNALAI